MKIREHLQFLALMLPTILLLAAVAVSMAWPSTDFELSQDAETIAVVDFLRAHAQAAQGVAEAPSASDLMSR